MNKMKEETLKKDIENEELLPWVIKNIKKHQLNHESLSFEITESDVMKDPQKSTKNL